MLTSNDNQHLPTAAQASPTRRTPLGDSAESSTPVQADAMAMPHAMTVQFTFLQDDQPPPAPAGQPVRQDRAGAR